MPIPKDMAPMPDDYSDYRLFLKARFEFLKTKRKNLSHAVLARKSKVAISYFKSVFARKKHVGLDKITVISEALELTPLESYFLLISVIGMTTTEPKLKYLCEASCRMYGWEMRVRAAENTKRIDVHSAPSTELLVYTLACLMKWPGFSADHKWLKRFLCNTSPSPETLRKAVAEADAFHARLAKEDCDLEKTRLAFPDTLKIVEDRGIVGNFLSEILSEASYRKVYDPFIEQCEFISLDKKSIVEMNKIVQKARIKILELSQRPKKGKLQRLSIWTQCVYTLAKNSNSPAD